ncbi:MAG: hypothetical protein MUF71_07805 [Candidatus Kapabacteria bacterium]|nr:hypothetical protein [Candidatus Kapabacteria bacterium]
MLKRLFIGVISSLVGFLLPFMGYAQKTSSSQNTNKAAPSANSTEKQANKTNVLPAPPEPPPLTPKQLARKDSLDNLAKLEIERLAALPKEDHKERATSLFRLLILEQYEVLEKNFDTTKIPARAKHLQAFWGRASGVLGDYRAINRITTERLAIGDVVVISAQFKNFDFDFSFNFDEKHAVIGFAYALAKQQYSPADSSLLNSITEQEITVTSGTYRLPGSLALPKSILNIFGQRYPIALLLHDQGPQDRDRSDNAYKPNKDLALGLGKMGIATLRYDKRMRLYQVKEQEMDKYTVNEETVDDAVQALQTIRELAKTYPIDTTKIIIIAPTLAAMVLPKILQQDERLHPASARVVGAVALALNYVKLYELMYPRFEHFFMQDGMTVEEVKQRESIMRRLETVQSAKLSLKTSIYDLPYGIAPSYWLDLRSYNHVEEISKLTLPLLLLYGEQDHDVDFTKNGLAWKKHLEGKPNVEWKSYPKLFHLFAEGNGTLRDYDRKGNVDAGCINDIAQWIGKR